MRENPLLFRPQQLYPFYHECDHRRLRRIGGIGISIVATGSSLGSTMARLGLLSYSERTLMIGCGAVAGIAAVYDAPIAGVMFAVEVLLTETVVSYFVPLVIAAVVGALCSKIYAGDSGMLKFPLAENFDYKNVPMYILMGVGRVFRSAE